MKVSDFIAEFIEKKGIKSVFEKWISNKITIEEFGILEIYNLYWNNIEKLNNKYIIASKLNNWTRRKDLCHMLMR